MTASLPPQTRPEWAARFFEAWFDGRDDAICVVSQMLPGAKKQARHRFGTAADLVEVLSGPDSLNQLVYDSGVIWNLYMGVGTLKERPEGNRKGGRRDTAKVPGVWIDLDTDKDGFFQSEDQCLEFLRSLDLLPSIVVATGTGGVHAYWKTRTWLDADDAEKVCETWWAYLREQAGVEVDRLTNCDRLMKLPGSVRWPKKDGEPATLVRLLYADPSVRYTRKRLMETGTAAYERYQGRLEASRQRVTEGRLRATYDASALTGWGLLLAMQNIEEDFSLRYTWRDILIPLGWTELGTDSENRTIWARPGLTPDQLHKSAATDYGDSQAMSLFSDSVDTGLQELAEAGVPLTKYRVFVECVWHGDEPGFVKAYVEEMQNDS